MSEKAKPLQFSLYTLLVILTLSCCSLAYLRVIGIWALGFGIWALLFAVGPPILIAACMNLALSPHGLAEVRQSRPQQQQQLSDEVRVLLSLVFALLLWIPVLLALTLR